MSKKNIEAPGADQVNQDAASAAPDELARLANTGAGLDADQALPGAEPDAAAEPERVQSAQLVNMVLAPAVLVMFPNWKISADELGQLSQAYAAVLDKYFPGGIEMGPELSAVAVTLMIVAPRVIAGTPRKLEEVKPPKPEQPAPGAAPGQDAEGKPGTKKK